MKGRESYIRNRVLSNVIQSIERPFRDHPCLTLKTEISFLSRFENKPSGLQRDCGGIHKLSRKIGTDAARCDSLQH